MSDEAEAFVRASRRSRGIKLAIFGLVILSPLIWVGYKNFSTRKRIEDRRDAHQKAIALTDDERAELAAAIPRARKFLDDAARTFVTVVTPANLDALQDAGTACPRRITAPTFTAGEDYIKRGSIDANYFGNASFTVHAPGAAMRPLMGHRLDTLLQVAGELAEHQADKHDLEKVRDIINIEDELLLVGELKPAAPLGDSYLPGQFTGFAYLYSYQARRVICFAALAVQNSETIEISYSAQLGNATDEMINKNDAARGTLERDLQVQIRQALSSRLKATL